MAKKARNPHNHPEFWFRRHDIARMLGVRPQYFDARIRPKIPKDLIEKRGHEVWVYGRAAMEAWSLSNTELRHFPKADSLPGRENSGDPMLAGSGRDSPALERFRMARALLAEADLREREKELADANVLLDFAMRYATHIREAGDQIRRNFGDEAAEILLERLADAERDLAALRNEAEHEAGE